MSIQTELDKKWSDWIKITQNKHEMLQSVVKLSYWDRKRVQLECQGHIGDPSG